MVQGSCPYLHPGPGSRAEVSHACQRSLKPVVGTFGLVFQKMDLTLLSHHRQIDSAIAVEIGSGDTLHHTGWSQLLARSKLPKTLTLMCHTSHHQIHHSTVAEIGQKKGFLCSRRNGDLLQTAFSVQEQENLGVGESDQIGPSVVVDILGPNGLDSGRTFRKGEGFVPSEESVLIDDEGAIFIGDHQIDHFPVLDQIIESGVQGFPGQERKLLAVITESRAAIVSQQHRLLAEQEKI